MNSPNNRNYKKRSFYMMQNDDFLQNSIIQKDNNANEGVKEKCANDKYFNKKSNNKFLNKCNFNLNLEQLDDVQIYSSPKKRVSFTPTVKFKTIESNPSESPLISENVKIRSSPRKKYVDKDHNNICQNKSIFFNYKEVRNNLSGIMHSEFNNDETVNFTNLNKEKYSHFKFPDNNLNLSSTSPSKSYSIFQNNSPNSILKNNNYNVNQIILKKAIEKVGKPYISLKKLDFKKTTDQTLMDSPLKLLNNFENKMKGIKQTCIAKELPRKLIEEDIYFEKESVSLLSPKSAKNLEEKIVLNKISDTISIFSLATPLKEDKPYSNDNLIQSNDANLFESKKLRSNAIKNYKMIEDKLLMNDNVNNDADLIDDPSIVEIVSSNLKTDINDSFKFNSSQYTSNSKRKLDFNNLTNRKSPRKSPQITDISIVEDKLLYNVPHYNPINFLRCHFGDKKSLKKGCLLDNDPSDDTTNVWACAFEPDLNDPNKTTNLVATCGGSTMCLIDCSTNLVLKRFKDNKEQFYCLAWTTLNINYKKKLQQSNFLALSGLNGKLKLIQPDNLCCYLDHGTGRPNKSIQDFYYSSLIFHPKNSNWLFCGSSDTTVTLFEISFKNALNLQADIKMMCIFKTNPTASIETMLIMKESINSNYWLFAGTTNGCLTWAVNDDLLSKKSYKDSKMILKFSSKGNVVDALASISQNLIACKVIAKSCIFVYDIENISDGRCPLVKKLDWYKTEIDYIGIASNSELILTGSDHGAIAFYSLKNILSNLDNSKSYPIDHTETWPKCNILNESNNNMNEITKPIINNVAIASDCKYIVAVTNNNLVCIWKQIEENPTS